MPRILLSNDDGYLAPGLAALAAAVRSLGSVEVVAPEQDRSGASNSLTLDRPLRVRKGHNGFHYLVGGTPTDCVHLAATGILPERPEMVISGINRGANMGDDVLYSGTVAAAMEGRHLGMPAMAISLAGREPEHYEAAARVAAQLLEGLLRNPLPGDTILNVNVPDLPYEEIRGFEVTRLGRRHKSDLLMPAADPRGEPVYWIGPSGQEADGGPGTDFDALRRGYVSITPLDLDMTRYGFMSELSQWLQCCKN